MSAHAAFLRGMNLGGRRISNAELASAFEMLGFAGVATFRASGNVLFESSGEPEGELVARIETGLQEALGYAVPTFVRSAAELRSIVAFEPFPLDEIAASGGKLQVTMFAERPSEEARAAALALATDEDRLNLTGRELYWLPSGGVLDSELDQGEIGRLLGPGTMRTMGTLEGVAGKLPL